MSPCNSARVRKLSEYYQFIVDNTGEPMHRLKQWLPAIIYAAFSGLGFLMALSWFTQPDWLFCRLTDALCVGTFGITGIILQALAGMVGLIMAVVFGYMLYRVIRLGGAHRVVNEADRLLMHKSIREIRQLCEKGDYGKALLLVESLRQKYPDNRQIRELEKRLNRSLDLSQQNRP